MDQDRGEPIDALSDVHKAAFSAFFECHGQLAKRIERRLEQANVIGLECYDVLLNLEMAPGRRLRMSQLAERIVYSRSGLTRLADRLEAQGFIVRVPCADDRRGMNLVLTEAGLRARTQAWTVFGSAIVEMFAPHLTVDEAVTLTGSFHAMMRAMGVSPVIQCESAPGTAQDGRANSGKKA
jgi:DNA-binding MarR family transcriptional regulator